MLTKRELLIHADQELPRIAARPPLSQPDSRKSAVTITLGLNDEFQLQGYSLEHLLEDASWGHLPHAAVSTNNEQQTNPEPRKPTSNLRSPSLTLCQTPAQKPADSL
jgi:hypothetical protein